MSFDGKIYKNYSFAIFDVQFTTSSPDFPNTDFDSSGIQVVNEFLLRDVGLEGTVFTRKVDPYVFNEYVVGVPLIVQPNNHSCWVTAATMLLSWRDGVLYSLYNALRIIGEQWYEEYRTNELWYIDGLRQI